MSMETVLNMISSLAPPSLAPPPDVSAHSAASAGPMLVDTAMAATAAAQLNSPRSHSSTASAGGPAMALASPIGASSSSATSTSSVVVAQMVSPTSRAATMAALPAQTPPPTAQRSRTFFRAPGLEAPDESAGAEFPTNALVCPDCGFSCSSKFHYNSHRNTHSKHQCPMCNFETRTEGRLKKHILQSHKREDRLAHGITISSPPPPPAQPQQQQQLHSPRQQHTEADNKCLLGPQPQMMMGGTPTSMGNLLSSMLSTADQSAANGSMALESLQSMLNNTNPLAQFSNSTDALLKICTDAIANNGPNEKAYSSPQMGDHLGAGGGHHHHHIPLEQLRALTERHTASLLATSTAANGVGLNFGELHIGAMNGCGENGQAQVALLEPKQETPQRRSGKPKRYKCKQCAHISRSKEENWAHSKQHIPKQKQLTCTLCDFVTEYKHHLEYHYRNHNGQKPFKCTICDYSCVNKSMLNSHMKSHTPVYQFRCQDCTYQTKYCHSLKMHLKKYNHKRAPGPGGFMDSSGEERPENASGSSIGREDIASFETSAANMAAQNGTDGGAEMGGGQHHHHHAATAALMLPPQLIGAGQHQEMEMDSQRMMLKQQLEQMNELIRNAMVNCPHCSFSTGNIDEMNRHLLFHLIATQQQMPPTLNNEQHALASIYQRLTAQLQHELVPSDAQQQQQQQEVSALLGRAFAAPSGATQNGGGDREMEQLHTGAGMGISDEDRARQMERDAAESIRQQQQQQQGQQQHFTPTTMAALLAAASQQSCSSSAAAGPDSGGECLTGGTTTSSTPSASNDLAGLQSHSAASMKREYPFGAELHARAMAEANNGGAAAMMMQDNKSAQVGGTCVIKSVMPTLISSIPGLTGNNGFGGGGSEANNNTNGYGVVGPQHFSNVQSPSSSASLPYYCQQCEIAFKDAALYQVHRGFHARESPFKCNICGHLSCSALDFNLHLYQAKHE